MYKSAEVSEDVVVPYNDIEIFDTNIHLQILKLMILLYFYPSTVDNQKLRQCLSYFLPVYCYSSSDIQPLLVEVPYTDGDYDLSINSLN